MAFYCERVEVWVWAVDVVESYLRFGTRYKMSYGGACCQLGSTNAVNQTTAWETYKNRLVDVLDYSHAIMQAGCQEQDMT